MAKRKLTEAQKKRLAELAEQTGDRIFDYGYQGGSVLRSVERYLKTSDSSKITRAAYDFLIMRCGFVAHYDHSGFVSYYRDIRVFLAEFAAQRSFDELRRAPSAVYADGMTDIEVLERLRVIVDTYAPEATFQAAQR